MLVSDVFSYLDELAPFSYSMDFDNSGLLIGDPSQSVKKILVALDCTKSVVSKARETGADLIVTHHPVIFDPLKNVMVGSVPHQLICAGISIICAHTNLDLARGGVNDQLARRLELKCLEGLSPISCTDRKRTLRRKRPVRQREPSGPPGGCLRRFRGRLSGRRNPCWRGCVGNFGDKTSYFSSCGPTRHYVGGCRPFSYGRCCDRASLSTAKSCFPRNGSVGLSLR